MKHENENCMQIVKQRYQIIVERETLGTDFVPI